MYLFDCGNKSMMYYCDICLIMMGEPELYGGITWATGSRSSVHYGGPRTHFGQPSPHHRPHENRHKIIRRTWLPNIGITSVQEWENGRLTGQTLVDWGWGYGEGARDWKKWWWDWCSRKILSALTVFYMVLLLSSPLGQNMGGGHDRWNNGDELFTCSAAGQCLGTQAVIHKLSGRHITDRLNSRPVFEANLSANESWALGRGELAL